VGVLGLVLAGFIAAIMSNTDSTLHAASTIITMDFAKKMFPEMGSRDLVRTGRITTITIILISAIWAPMIGNFGTLFEYVQGLLSYAVAPFVVVYLGGIFLPRANAVGAMRAIVVGVLLAFTFGLLRSLGIIDLHYLYVPLPIAIVCASVLHFSCCEKVLPSEKQLTLRPSHIIDLNFNTLILPVGLTALVLIQLWYFW